MRSCSNLEAMSAQLVPEERTELRGEKLSEAYVARRRLVTAEVLLQLTKEIRQRMWVELLRDEGSW